MTAGRFKAPEALRAPRPPAMSGDGGFDFGLGGSDGRPKIFEQSVQPSSRDLCKEYGIEIHEDPTTVSSLKKQKKDSNSSDEDGADTRTSTVSELRVRCEETSGETSESEAHADTRFARTHSVGGHGRWCRARARLPRPQRWSEGPWGQLTPHAHGAGAPGPPACRTGRRHSQAVGPEHEPAPRHRGEQVI